jgi:hypothetical protein
MMVILRAVLDQLVHGAVQSIVGLAAVAIQLVLYLLLLQTRPRIRFHKLKDYGNHRVTFLIRNLDSVRYRDGLVVVLEPRSAIEWVGVHAGPHSDGPPTPEPDSDSLAIVFRKVPADATFSIKVELRPETTVRLRLADRSPLRPRNFDDKLEPQRGVRGFGHFLLRGLAGLIGFATVLVFGLYLDGDAPSASDWPYLGAGLLLALGTFVLVVQTGGKPIVAGYLGWSEASKDWSPPADPAPPIASIAPVAPVVPAPPVAPGH